MVKKLFRKTLLILLGLIIILNFLGLIIEFLIQFKIIKVENVNIRNVLSFAGFLSLAFIIIGTMFWIQFYKRRKTRLILLWNSLMITSLIIVIYKLLKPTVLSNNLYYFIVNIILIPAIWFVVFKHLKKQGA